MTKTLLEAAKTKKRGTVSKVSNYFKEYDLHMAEFKDKPIRLLEIGVGDGGSLYMWKEYFSSGHIVGIDIDPSKKKFQGEGIEIYIGDQVNSDFLKEIEGKYGQFDIVIDDGGHQMKQQITSFKTLFPLLREGGVYVIEDLHTSYWPNYGARFGRTTTINLVKKLIDTMHFWCRESALGNIFFRLTNKLGITKHQIPSLNFKSKNIFQKSIRSITIADSICFIKKETIPKYEVTNI